MVWGSVLRARTLFLLPTSTSANLGRSGRFRRNFVNGLGTWNVRGINETTKREEMVDILKTGKFDLLALTETKLKGIGEVSWVEINGIIFGVEEVKRAREGVSVLLSDV